MKFIHIADVHLGGIPGGVEAYINPSGPVATCCYENQRDNTKLIQGFASSETLLFEDFEKVLASCEEESIDLLLIAGDLFHRQPKLSELKELNYKFSKLSKTKVILIAGNHDFISSRSQYLKIDWHTNVTMFFSEEVTSIYIEELNTEIYGFSYYTREIKEPKVDRIEATNRERINILMAHGGSSNSNPMNFNKIAGNGFDYVALGHIHTPKVIKDNIVFTGSFTPMDRTEIGERGYVAGEIKESMGKKNLSFTFIPSARIQYNNLVVEVNPQMTNSELKDKVKELTRDYFYGRNYNIYLEGQKAPDMVFLIEDIKELPGVHFVLDTSTPYYDFHEVYIKNKDNLLGSFIKTMNEKSLEEEIKEKALYYGITALLGLKG